MKSTLAILFAVFLAAQAKVVPTNGVNAHETATQPIQLNEMISQAQANINTLATQIREQLNIPDHDTVVNTMKEQSTNFITNVQAYMKNVTEEMKTKSPELERLWTDVKGKLNKVVDDISATLPNANEQFTQLQTKLHEGVQTLVKESNNVAKTFGDNSGKIQEDVAKFTKQAVDIAVQATQNLNNQLQQAVAAKS